MRKIQKLYAVVDRDYGQFTLHSSRQSARNFKLGASYMRIVELPLTPQAQKALASAVATK